VEQRYQAVLAVIRDGVSIVQVAHRFGVSRQAVHRWLRWYEDQGLGGLVDRSHRPPRCSHQMAPAVEVWVLEARRRNPDWGPRRLVHEASRAGVEPVPSHSGINHAAQSRVRDFIPSAWRRFPADGPLSNRVKYEERSGEPCKCRSLGRPLPSILFTLILESTATTHSAVEANRLLIARIGKSTPDNPFGGRGG
jgi:transposase